ncbi:hypothetical protein JCM11251_001107 [Rhodosporidiobolus azoricus]
MAIPDNYLTTSVGENSNVPPGYSSSLFTSSSVPTSGGSARPDESGSSMLGLNAVPPIPARTLQASSLMDGSPPMTPAPTPSSSFAGGPGSAARIRAISPPTPAPSPQPHVRDPRERATLSSGGVGWRQKGATDSTSPFFDPNSLPTPPPAEPDLIEQLRAQINALSPSARQELMAQLVHDSTAADLSTLLPLITPRLKRDFLRTLPLELAFHVLSFMDDARTLARASAVSHFWRALLEDEATWKRMCWQSGFVPPASAVASLHSSALELPKTPWSPGGPRGAPLSHTGERLRMLEFGPRPAEDDNYLYTPAGRERRGTLDRDALSEFAARVAHFDLPPDETAGGTAGSRIGGMGLGLGDVSPAATSTQPPSRIAARRGHAQVPPLAVGGSIGGGRGPAGGGIIDLSSLSNSLPLSQLPPPRPDPAALRFNQQFASPPVFAPSYGIAPNRSTTVPSLTVPSSLHSHLPSYASSHLSALAGPSTTPAFPPTATSQPTRPAQRAPFSYKRHFKTAYLTQDAWLHGPGRLLSTQMSADDGVVTSLGFSDEHIVVGMATSKVHVFDAATGTYVRTLEGHELGVWCLTLVMKGGGPRQAAASEASEDGWDDMGKGKNPATPAAFNRPLASPMGTTFSQPGFPSSSSASSLHAPGSSSASSYTNFFRDGTRTPLAASFHSSPSSPNHAPLPRRRRSFPSSSSSPSSPSSPPDVPSSGKVSNGEATGGMGIGAGGPTGDSREQANVCGTARGWGQEGAIVVSGGCDRDVRVWEVETGRCLHILKGHTSTVRCMRVLDGRPIAISGSRDRTLRVWDIVTGECLHVLSGHTDSVRCLEVHGNKVVSGSYDATCRLWNVDTGEIIHVLRGHVRHIYSVAFDGTRIVTGSVDATVRVWNAETGEFTALLQGHVQLVGQLQLNPVSNVLVTGGSDGKVLVFDLDTFEAKYALQAHEQSVTSLQVDSRFIVTAGNDGRIRLWDCATGHFIRELADPADAVWRCVVRDDRYVMLSRRNDRTLMDVRSFRPSAAEPVDG